MGVDELLKNELGEKRWKIRKRLIETDEKMRSKTVDRLIKSTPKRIKDKVDTYCDELVKRNKQINLFEKIPNGSAIWVKYTGSGEWYLCEWIKHEESTILGTATIILGQHKGIELYKQLGSELQFEEFIIVKKPETLRPNQVRWREVEEREFEFDVKIR